LAVTKTTTKVARVRCERRDTLATINMSASATKRGPAQIPPRSVQQLCSRSAAHRIQGSGERSPLQDRRRVVVRLVTPRAEDTKLAGFSTLRPSISPIFLYMGPSSPLLPNHPPRKLGPATLCGRACAIPSSVNPPPIHRHLDKLRSTSNWVRVASSVSTTTPGAIRIASSTRISLLAARNLPRFLVVSRDRQREGVLTNIASGLTSSWDCTTLM